MKNEILKPVLKTDGYLDSSSLLFCPEDRIDDEDIAVHKADEDIAKIRYVKQFVLLAHVQEDQSGNIKYSDDLP